MNPIHLTPPQRWRLAVLVLKLCALCIMMIPGSFVWCNAEKMYYSASYLWNDPTGIVMKMVFGLTVISFLIALVAYTKQKTAVVLPCILDLLALGVIGIIPLQFAVQAFGNNNPVFLPFFPPILLMLSMITAVIAWFIGRKAEKKQ